ncbi:AraC family transcriptional regulator ligand-binding domain-containing protein, partial [Acinetobacter baumannii]
DIIALGKLLPLVCEFWFSSMQTLIERVLDGPFQAKKLLLPYPAPDYAEEYEKVFHCPVQFNAGVMQWHFDLKWLDVPCPNANPITA